ncbi:MAG: hypothetical protein WC068_00600 [Caulobacter sp.]
MIARVACLMLLFAAGPALAQDLDRPISIPGGGPREAPPPPGPPPPQVFISPAGEPFRAEQGQPYPAARWFGRADADHDGGLTREEFVADALAFFDRLDTDKDQVVDGFENVDYERNVAPEIMGIMPSPVRREGAPPLVLPPTRGEQVYGRPSFLHPRGRPMPARRQGAAQYSLINEPHPVRGADADLDQRVSRAEATAAARMRFGLLDVDGDGGIALADLPKTPAQSLARGPAEGGRGKRPGKDVEMRLQPAAVNAIEVAAPAAKSSRETP